MTIDVGPPWQRDDPRVALLHSYTHVATNFRRQPAYLNHAVLAGLPRGISVKDGPGSAGIHDLAKNPALDEEMVNLIQFQRAYEASARYISTVDQVMQTLINM